MRNPNVCFASSPNADPVFLAWGIGLLNGESFDCPHGPADSVGDWPPPPVASPPVAPVVPPAPAKFKRYLTEKTPGFRAAFAEHMKRHTRMAGRLTK